MESDVYFTYLHIKPHGMITLNFYKTPHSMRMDIYCTLTTRQTLSPSPLPQPTTAKKLPAPFQFLCTPVTKLV